ncbi:hypothetical protein [Oceanobacillus kimchii]|uniref:hypothetical protein n=1 Tax=Oceanobacillus kimchii TaxID=746691 RepID=UPI00034CD43D|nr:hypothetical protein [Oceanobacillus kimchii]
MSRLENKQFLKAEATLLHKLGVANDHEPITDKEQELIDYIIHQAQKAEELQAKVEELEKEKDEWKDTAQSYYVTNQELREKNKRYKQALEEVKSLTINPREYQPSTYTIHHIVSDALKGVEG